MRSFAEVREEWGLSRFLASELGTLYFVPAAPGSRRTIVRHFDSVLPPALVPAYADLVRAVRDWVDARPELAELLTVEVPEEVGEDFVARPHHTYYNSVESYDLGDSGLAPPPELAELRRRTVAAVAVPAGDRDAVIGRALARSVLESTAKTYFDGHRFVAVEPKLSREDVEEWAALTGR